MRSKGNVIEPMVSALIRITCPIAIVGAHHPISLYWALVANIATYALVGLVKLAGLLWLASAINNYFE
jgi:hypothetical protein